MSLSSSLEKIASIREGSSPGAKARPIKRLQAGVAELREQEQSVFRKRLSKVRPRRTTLGYSGRGGVVGISGHRALK